VSVPRREGVSSFVTPGSRFEVASPGVSLETSNPGCVPHKFRPKGQSRTESRTESRSAVLKLSTGKPPAAGTPLSACCVPSVPSAVASRKRTPLLRIVALRPVASAYPPASPKSTLARVFDRMKRAARTEKFARISERLVPLSDRLSKRSVDAYPASKAKPGIQ
jgi:hypothetical protein